MAELKMTIIDPPFRAQYDIDVAREWVKELKSLKKAGYDVAMYLGPAKKDLARLEKLAA